MNLIKAIRNNIKSILQLNKDRFYIDLTWIVKSVYNKYFNRNIK